MVGYMHDSNTLLMIRDQAFQVVRSQSNVKCDKERNAHSSCLYGNQTDIFELPEETEYIEETEKDGNGLLHDNAGTTRTGEGHGSGDHDCTGDDTDHNLPDKCGSSPASTGVRSHPPDEEPAPLVSRETVVQNRHLCPENYKVRQMADLTKQ